MKTKNLSIEKHREIIDLYKNGNNKSQIVKMMKITRGCIRGNIKKHAKHEFARSGRLRMTSEREDRNLVRFQKKNLDNLTRQSYNTWQTVKNPSLSTAKCILFCYG